MKNSFLANLLVFSVVVVVVFALTLMYTCFYDYFYYLSFAPFLVVIPVTWQNLFIHSKYIQNELLPPPSQIKKKCILYTMLR